MKKCAHPHHHHDTESLLREVRERAESLGLRFTPLRAKVLELIANSSGPAKAYDLLERLKHEHDSAAPPTVYRAIEFLLEHGFVHKVESINAFIACPHPSGQHVAQFLVCDQCGSATELESEQLPEMLRALASAQNFNADKLIVEVHGQCANCQQSQPVILLSPPQSPRKSITKRLSQNAQ
jgi:Fur family transcriptional regulator, zinc uptake regulator